MKFQHGIALTSSLLMLTACGHDNELLVEESIGDIAVQMVMPEDGKAVHPDFGKEEWFAYGALSGVGGHAANGVMQSYRFENGSFAHTIQANILPPEDGYFLEGWLVHPETKDVLSTGQLKNHFGDSRHSLRFDSDRDLTAYTKVVVTLEPDDGDPAPAEHVADGELKHVER